MLPFSMALMSGLKRQSVGATMASMPGSSSLRDIAKCVKLYICARKRRNYGYYIRVCYNSSLAVFWFHVCDYISSFLNFSNTKDSLDQN